MYDNPAPGVPGPPELARITASVTTRLLTVENLEAAAQAIVDQVCRALNADIGYLASADEARQRLTFLAASGLPAQFVEERRALRMDASTVVSKAARTRELQVVADLDETGDELAVSRKLSSLGMRSVIAVPLIALGELVGVLAIARRTPGPISAPERSALEEVAVACALGLNHARALEAARRAQLETARRLDELERQHRLLAVILAQAPSGIVAFDAPEGRVLFANDAARTLLGKGLTRGPAIDGLTRPDGTALLPSERPQARALTGLAVTDEELLLVREDGRAVPVLVNAAPVKADRGVQGAVVVLRDLTAEKELERLRGEFSAVIAHDLRNPIQVVLLQTHLLLAEDHGPDLVTPRRAIERIRGAAVRLSRMVSDLLDASRIDVARLVLDRRPIAIADAVDRLVDQLRPMLGKHPVSVKAQGEVGAALLDPVRFDQILANLLENAAKYSPESSPIRVFVEPGDGGVVIRVVDEGEGFSPAELTQVFGRFFQARRTRAGQGGLGLGLHITRGLVEAHGGQIALQTTWGHGSTFRLWFPVTMDERNDPTTATAHP